MKVNDKSEWKYRTIWLYRVFFCYLSTLAPHTPKTLIVIRMKGKQDSKMWKLWWHNNYSRFHYTINLTSTYIGQRRPRIVCWARRHKRLSVSFNFPTLHAAPAEEDGAPVASFGSSQIVSSPLCCRLFLRFDVDRRRFTDIHSLVQSVVALLSPSLIRECHDFAVSIHSSPTLAACFDQL